MDALLKLRAVDAEDMQVISAVLQDGIVPICDVAFQPDSKSFVMVVQRLRREAGSEGASERICSALTISGVTAVKTCGIDAANQDRMLDLLALMVEDQKISLVFAGEAKIRLELFNWAAALEDFGETWPTIVQPQH
jgi:hypothetical protein